MTTCFDELPLEIQLIKGYLPTVVKNKYVLAATVTTQTSKQQLGKQKALYKLYILPGGGKLSR